MTKKQVSAGDQETLNFISYIEHKTGIGIRSFLNAPQNQYRAYRMEDESVLTDVFY